MHVEVRYFADAREATAVERETFDLAEPVRVADVLAAACAKHPALAAVRAACRVALNESFATDDMQVPAGATVALIPPVGGG